MDPMRFLESRDEMDVALMHAIAEEYVALLETLDQNRAVMIANAVWSAVK